MDSCLNFSENEKKCQNVKKMTESLQKSTYDRIKKNNGETAGVNVDTWRNGKENFQT